MSLFDKMKSKEFWTNVNKIAIPFFVFFVFAMLLMNNWRDILAADLAKVIQDNFSNGLWIRFFGFKLVISYLYGIWMTNKNMKK